MGQAGQREHILEAGDTPIIATDRGGQVTWHGPGQIIAYPLLDLRRRRLGVRNVVHALEGAVITMLAAHGLSGERQDTAPGVYLGGAKAAAVGLRVCRGSSYHGVALNVANDLEPFNRINPCGYADLSTTRLRDYGVATPLQHLETELARYIVTAITNDGHTG